MFTRVFSFKRTMGDSDNEIPSLPLVRNQIVNTAIVVFSILVVPALIASVFRMNDPDWDNRFIIQYCISALMLLFMLVHKKYSFRIRTFFLLTAIFSMSVTGILVYGFIGGGLAGFLIFCILSLTLIGRKESIIALVLSLIAIAAIGISLQIGLLKYKIDFNNYLTSPLSWIFAILMMLLIGGGLIFSIESLLGSLMHSIKLLNKKTVELEDSNRKLQLEIKNREIIEKELKKEKDFTESIIDSLPGAFYLYNEQKRLIRWNKNHEILTGYSPEELYLKHVLEGIPENEHNKVLYTYDKILERGKGEVEADFISKDGRNVPFYYIAKSIKIDGKLYLAGFGFDISDRKKAEKALLESEELYRKLVTSIPDIIVRTDLEGNVIFINETEKTSWGYVSNENILGKNIFSFIIPSDRDRALENVRNMFERSVGPKEYVMKFEEEKLTDCEVNGEILRESDGLPYGMVFVIRNITERKLAEKQLEEYKLRLEKLVDDRTYQLAETNKLLEEEIEKLKLAEESVKDQLSFFEITLKTVPIPVFVKDFSGRYVNCNKLFEEIHGLLRNEIIGKSVDYMIGFPDNEIHEEMDKIIYENGNIISYPGRYLNKSGEPRDAIFSKAPLKKSDGHTIGIIGVVQDVTESKTLEKNIKKSLEKERELNELKSRFISTTSHEFRTPLTAILSSSDLLEIYGRNWPEDKYKKHTSQIRRSVRYMTELLDDILEISRIDSGKISFSPDFVDLFTLCTEVIEIVKVKASKKHRICLNYLINEKEFKLDEKLIRHILTNLVSNAIKYSPEGGNVELSISIEENLIQFNIKDEGIGIPADEMKNLTTPFFRAQNASHIPGTGLGLSIVKKAVEMHGGNLYFESQMGIGSVFCVSIPLIDIKSNTTSLKNGQDFNN